MVKIACTSVLQVPEKNLSAAFYALSIMSFFHELLSSVIVLCFMTLICTVSYIKGRLDPKYC